MVVLLDALRTLRPGYVPGKRDLNFNFPVGSTASPKVFDGCKVMGIFSLFFF